MSARTLSIKLEVELDNEGGFQELGAIAWRVLADLLAIASSLQRESVTYHYIHVPPRISINGGIL